MIQYVATEYGVAMLSGLSVRERMQAMTRIAHPAFRDGLVMYAEKYLRGGPANRQPHF